jgi:hydrogenase-1 operon protein HyaE
MIPTLDRGAAAPPALHPLLARLVSETGADVLAAEAYDAWAAQPGPAMVVFAEDPDRYKETLDLAVIVPELHATAGGQFRVALLLPAASRALASRYGFTRWPAFVILRDGQYVGAVDGIRDWDVYVGELERLLASPPTRPPSVGIAIKIAGSPDEPTCH